MIILISGASHTGKTALAQKMLEKYGYPHLSIDHLKMGLIRAGMTELTPCSDNNELTSYLWPIVREMIKTAVENNQNLIVEGCYIPFDWKKDFDDEYLYHITYRCLVMTPKYINNHFDAIVKFASIIEERLDDGLTKPAVIKDNEYYLEGCKKEGLEYILIDDSYETDFVL